VEQVTDPLIWSVVSCGECPFAAHHAGPEVLSDDEHSWCGADDERRAIPRPWDAPDRPAWCPLDVRPVLVRIAAPRPDVDDSAAGVRFSLLEME
jgi:hypothetical protein